MSVKSKISSLLTLGKGVVRGLNEDTAGNDPISLFQAWFADAERAGIYLPEAMSVATSTPDGAPSARMMLLKDVDARGFTFYTNYESRKGLQLSENPRAALVFHWAVIQRQVRIEGTVAKLSAEESEAYFQTRARGSRLGAWASQQSAPVENRGALEARFRDYEHKFGKGDIPLPPYWGGYRVTPQRIEFWQGRLNRLHDRICYVRNESGWTKSRLNP